MAAWRPAPPRPYRGALPSARRVPRRRTVTGRGEAASAARAARWPSREARWRPLGTSLRLYGERVELARALGPCTKAVSTCWTTSSGIPWSSSNCCASAGDFARSRRRRTLVRTARRIIAIAAIPKMGPRMKSTGMTPTFLLRLSAPSRAAHQLARGIFDATIRSADRHVKLHAVAEPREAHERHRRLPRANPELREAPRDEVFAVADPARERLGDVGPLSCSSSSSA